MLGKLKSMLGRGRVKPTSQSPDTDRPRVVFDDGGVEKVLFTLPPTKRPDLDSVAVFAMPKSGSVLLDNLMRDLSAEMGLTYVTIMGEYFLIGLPGNKMPAETSAIFVEKGYCYGGFRYFPRRFEVPILDTAKPILLVRDPRDMLVSHYFSVRHSHPEPGKALKSVDSKLVLRDDAQTLEVDDYVHKAAPAFRTYLSNYRAHLCEKHDTRIFRYEDVIYEKGQWVHDIATHFGWDISRELADKIAAKQDIIPSQESAKKHVRQVHPGNFKKKLRPDTIQALDEFFKEEMAYFGYEPWKE